MRKDAGDRRERASFKLGDLDLKFAADRTFTGYGAVFGNVDSHGDVIVKGAFRRTLREHAAAKTMPAMLSQHGGGWLGGGEMPIGVWSSMEEDDYGLKVAGRLSDTDRGREAYILLKDRALSGLSIGYETRQAINGTKPGEPRRKLVDVELWEVSLVTFPSNPEARVDTVKAAGWTPRDCERALRDAGVPRELAKAIVAKGWRTATDQRDADGGNNMIEAVKAAAATLTALSKRI